MSFSFRYLVIQISIANIVERSYATFNDTVITVAILKKILDYYDLSTKIRVENGFMCKYFNDQTKMCIIRFHENNLQIIRDIIPLLNFVGSTSVKCHLLYNGGTLERCRRFITNYQKSLLSDVSKGNLVINDSIGKLLNSGL